jgi:hypothetical protein
MIPFEDAVARDAALDLDYPDHRTAAFNRVVEPEGPACDGEGALPVDAILQTPTPFRDEKARRRP